MTKEDASSKTTKDPKSKDEPEEFKLTPEMQEYLDIRRVSGESFSLETDRDKHFFTKSFNAWFKAGKPRPKMERLEVPGDPIPQKLYRTRHLGKQKVFWRDTQGELHGRELIERPVTRNVLDSKTGQEMVQTVRTDTVMKYTLDYNAEVGKKLVAEALDQCVNPTFYFIDHNGSKYSVRPEDFNGDFDAIIKAHLDRRYRL